MRFPAPLSVRAPLLALALLGGCESDTAELIQEINAAREGCTEEKLKSADEECVAMMERYAGMGTEAIETYIGAVKSLDQALRRTPPAQFDTAGLGHALSPAAAADAWGDSSRALHGLYSTGPAFSRQSGARAPSGRWRAPAYPGGGGYVPDPRDPDQAFDEYGEHDGYDPGYGGPGYADPYGQRPPSGHPRGGSYDPRDPQDPRQGRWQDPGRGPFADTRPGDDPRRWRRHGYGDGYGESDRWREAGPPARGQMLPPDQRLRRPWIEEEREWVPGRGVRPGRTRGDTLYGDWEPERSRRREPPPPGPR